jgi:hypothetical protein
MRNAVVTMDESALTKALEFGWNYQEQIAAAVRAPESLASVGLSRPRRLWTRHP